MNIHFGRSIAPSAMAFKASLPASEPKAALFGCQMDEVRFGQTASSQAEQIKDKLVELLGLQDNQALQEAGMDVFMAEFDGENRWILSVAQTANLPDDALRQLAVWARENGFNNGLVATKDFADQIKAANG